ncbi:MAG: DUF4215 domain-containing protein, partial [Myxococcota bacterium]|nr:DUF4215 domain-containing protein [Myxococcota bacterium]
RSNEDACLNSCVPARCGDGNVHRGVEACDDGNEVQTDGCLNSCEAAACGDGFVQAGVEECDDANGVDSDACTNACRRAVCGDGIVGPGEDCDDGNQVDDDNCPNSCSTGPCPAGSVAVLANDFSQRDCNRTCGDRFDTWQINRNRLPAPGPNCGNDAGCVANVVCGSIGYSARALAHNTRPAGGGNSFNQSVHDGGGGTCNELCRGSHGANRNPPYFLFDLICCAP